MPRQVRYVVAPLAQWRQLDLQQIEPEIQIGTKHALLDERVQVAMRRGDHANVDRGRAPRSEFHHFALLQHAQQSALQRCRHFADFIEKDRPRMRDFEQPRVAAAPCAGERPLLVAEQFTFDQPFRQGRAIERDEWVARAGGSHYECPARPVLYRCRFRQ